MILYFVALAVVLLLCRSKSSQHLLPNGEYAQRFMSYRIAFFVLLPLTLLAVFRWDVGVDSVYGYNYWDSFHKAASWQNPREFEPGFFLLSAVLSKTGISYWGYLTILSTLFMSGVTYAIYKGSVSTTWSVLVFFLLYVYFDSYNSLRQTLAEAISLIVWANMCSESTRDRNDVKNVVLLLIASSLHTTALINLPIYFVCKMKFDQKNLLIFAVVAVAATPILQVILRSVMQLVAGEKYTFIGFALINAVLSGVIFACSWYAYNHIVVTNSYAYRYVNLSLCIFILILNSSAMLLPFRVFDMLKIGYILIVPYILKSLNSGKAKFLLSSMLLCIFGAWFFNAFFIQDSAYVNYQTVFSDLWTRITLP